VKGRKREKNDGQIAFMSCIEINERIGSDMGSEASASDGESKPASERARRFKEEMEARCQAMKQEALRASELHAKLKESLSSLPTRVNVEKEAHNTSLNEAAAAASLDASASPNAEQLVKALLQSQREREAVEQEEEQRQRLKALKPAESESDLDHGLQKAQLRDELDLLREQVRLEALKLEDLQHRTAEFQKSTSSDEAVVNDKLTKTRTQLTLLENEQAQVEGEIRELTEDLQYQHKSSVTVRKAYQDEEIRLREQLEALNSQIKDEEERLEEVKSETGVAIGILEEHEEYIEKLRNKLEGLETDVSSKTALLQELDNDQGSMEEEVSALQASLAELRKEEVAIKERNGRQESQARDSVDALKKDIERLQEDRKTYQADVERSQAVLAEAVELLQDAKEAAEKQHFTPSIRTRNPLSSPTSFYDGCGIDDECGGARSQMASPISGVRLFDDSPMRYNEEDIAYRRLMTIEKAAQEAEARRSVAESNAKEAEIRLRRMVNLVSRTSSKSGHSSPPFEPRSPYSGSSTPSRDDGNVVNSLEQLRIQLKSGLKSKSNHESAATFEVRTPREELHSKLNQLISEIGKVAKSR
jgi:hypothetical protein